MSYRDLRDFIGQLERSDELRRIGGSDPNLEMTEICDRVLNAGGPALLFEKPKGHAIPVLGNLFGTTRRIALAMGASATRTRGKRFATSACCSHSSRSRSRRVASATCSSAGSRSGSR